MSQLYIRKQRFKNTIYLLVLLQPSPRKEAKARKAPKSPKKKKVKVEEPKDDYVEDDVQLVMEVTQQQEQRYPVIDPTRPFVCQKCGVSFAREKALLSHSKVKSSYSIVSSNTQQYSDPFLDAWR